MNPLKTVSHAARAIRKMSPKVQMKSNRAKRGRVALMKVLPTELESQEEFPGFTEWLHTFELYRGKKAEDESEHDESRVVGKFKGSIRVHRQPLTKSPEEPRWVFSQGRDTLLCMYRT